MSSAVATKKGSSVTSKVKLQPLNDRLVVRREEFEQKTAGGIVLPDSAKEKPSRGHVVSVGPGRALDDGTRATMQVKVGDHVLFTSYAPEPFKIGDDELLLLSESDVLAVLEK